tara:strand:+ start:493 stop:681 length:189 start_codon:yes stop_codon:yes gene_type:complete
MKNLSADSPTVFLKIRVLQTTIDRMKMVAPAGNVSYFVREAIETSLTGGANHAEAKRRHANV